MANDPRFPPIKVNLVDHTGWKPFDPTDKITEWANDAAWEDLRHMDADDLETYVYDLSDAKGKRGGKPRWKFSSDEIEWLAKQVKENPDLVEETRNAIVDAMTWMYEAAYMPQKGDIQEAMESAVETLIDDYPLNHDLWGPVLALEALRRGPKEWSPRKRLEATEILKDLLEHVSLEQEEGHYDRYLVFDFRNAKVVHDLLSRSTWQRAMLENALGREFDDLSETYLWRFFDALKNNMEDLDIQNRTDWRKAWRSMLSDGQHMKAVQKEMAEAVKQMPPPETEDA